MGGYNAYNGYKNSVEIFNPITRRTCIVGSMTMARASHTMCNNMVCGGGSGVRSHKSQDSCEKFDGISGFSSLPVKLVHGYAQLSLIEKKWARLLLIFLVFHYNSEE